MWIFSQAFLKQGNHNDLTVLIIAVVAMNHGKLTMGLL